MVWECVATASHRGLTSIEALASGERGCWSGEGSGSSRPRGEDEYVCMSRFHFSNAVEAVGRTLCDFSAGRGSVTDGKQKESEIHADYVGGEDCNI